MIDRAGHLCRLNGGLQGGRLYSHVVEAGPAGHLYSHVVEASAAVLYCTTAVLWCEAARMCL